MLEAKNKPGKIIEGPMRKSLECQSEELLCDLEGNREAIWLQLNFKKISRNDNGTASDVRDKRNLSYKKTKLGTVFIIHLWRIDNQCGKHSLIKTLSSALQWG